MTPVTATSPTHTANLMFGWLDVRARAEPSVRITTIDASGVQTETKPFSQVFPGANPGTLFSAYWWGPYWAQVDCAAGVQRWAGTQSLQAVRKALYKCGFTPKQATTLIREMRRQHFQTRRLDHAS